VILTRRAVAVWQLPGGGTGELDSLRDAWKSQPTSRGATGRRSAGE